MEKSELEKSELEKSECLEIFVGLSSEERVYFAQCVIHELTIIVRSGYEKEEIKLFYSSNELIHSLSGYLVNGCLIESPSQYDRGIVCTIYEGLKKINSLRTLQVCFGYVIKKDLHGKYSHSLGC